MAKFTSKLSKEEVGKIFYKLCLAIAKIKKPEEAAEFLRDLLSFQESEMIAKRLKIAEFLLDGCTYSEIRKNIKVSDATIARVQEWLNISGDGYRKVVKSISGGDLKIKEFSCNTSMRSIKKKYPMYYWPEIVLENIIENSNKKQREKLVNIIEQMDKMKEKTDLYIKLNKLIKKEKRYR